MISLLLRLLLNLLAAHAAATPHLPARLLLAVGYVESRFEPNAVSDPHHGWPRWCGVMQTTAYTRAECERQQTDTLYAYRQGARELEAWWPYSPGDLCTLLAHYGCGFASASCNNYPARVLRIYERLRGVKEIAWR